MWAIDMAESRVNVGEVLIARSNTTELVGRVAQYLGNPPNVIASDLTIRLWAPTVLTGEYLSRYLSFLYLTGYWKDRAGGASGSMKKITRSQLVELPVPFPSAEVQEKVVILLRNDLERSEALLAKLQHQVGMIATLPQSLLRQAFSGAL
jgi:type I restriction enzyme S subunit